MRFGLFVTKYTILLKFPADMQHKLKVLLHNDIIELTNSTANDLTALAVESKMKIQRLEKRTQ